MSNKDYEDKLTFQVYDEEKKTNFNPARYTFGDMKNKKVKGTVYLLACAGGEGPEKDNVAWMFARKTGAFVLASPAGVSFHKSAGGRYYASVAPHSDAGLFVKAEVALFGFWCLYGYNGDIAVINPTDSQEWPFRSY